MREKMVEHRVRADCVQCHRMMDPIGFALENFDAIGLWRSHDEGTPVDASAQLFDGTDGRRPCGSAGVARAAIHSSSFASPLKSC